MKYLFVFNDSLYGSQRTYNGLRWALFLSRKAPIRIFFLGDGVTAAIAGLTPAHSDYNSQEMLVAIAKTGSEIAACGTCLEARGLMESLIPEVRRSSLEELSDWASDAEKIISF
jgi:uncharacterized protein involved in oxidation of intracellular sulfur